MHSIKYTKFHSFSGKASKNMPLLTSVQIIKSYDPNLKSQVGRMITKHTYYESDINYDTKELLNISVKDDIDSIIDKLEKLDLPSLKNNYYTDKIPESFTHWELEYDMFKIVGTYDIEPKEIKEIEKILNIDEIINNYQKQIEL